LSGSHFLLDRKSLRTTNGHLVPCFGTIPERGHALNVGFCRGGNVQIVCRMSDWRKRSRDSSDLRASAATVRIGLTEPEADRTDAAVIRKLKI